MKWHGNESSRLALVLALFFSSAALGVPSLQLYIPGAAYNTDMEAWLTLNQSFELQVLGAQTPGTAESITDVTLLMAIPDPYWNRKDSFDALSISIEPIKGTAGSPATLGLADMEEYGTPTLGESKTLPPHGVYPAHHFEVGLADLMVATAGQTVNNYNPGEDGSSDGDILYYSISYEPYDTDTLLVMDVIGFLNATQGQSRWISAPYSHNAVAHMPEPGVVSLFAIGLAGVALRLRRRIRAKQG